MICPDALLLRGLIVFPHVASRGFSLTLPDLRHAGPEVLNGFNDAWQNILLQLPPGMGMQVQTTRDNDLQCHLDRYTERSAADTNPWSRRARQERAQRYQDRLNAGTLYRQRVVIFLCEPLNDAPSWLSSPLHLEQRYRSVLDQVGANIERQADSIRRALAPFGASVTALDDAAHHRYFAHLLNPSLVHRPKFDVAATFDPSRSVHANCWWSEAQGQPFGFLMDGYYHTQRVATRWPATTNPLTLQPLCDLVGPNYRFTVNLAPMITQQVIQKEERSLRRLEGEYESTRKPSLLPAIEKKRRRVQNLATGLLRPFEAEFLIHTWADTLEGMMAQGAAAEQAMRTAGFQYYSPTLPTTHHRLFGQMWPGYPFGSYPHYRLYAESTFVPDLVLLRPSFTGHLDEAEALYEGVDGCPVGLRTSSCGSPQHLLVIGGTDSGKSMLLQDLLTQIWPELGLLFLVDYGGSYEVLVRALDPTCQILAIRPNAGFVFNYLDTQGGLLTSEFLGGAATMVSLMAGMNGEQEDRKARAVAADAIRQLYLHRFSQLEREQPERAMRIARTTLAWEQFRTSDPMSEIVGSFTDYRDWTKANPDEAQAKEQSFAEEEVVRALKDNQNRQRIAEMACASLAPHEQPTHAELKDWLRLYASAQHEPLALELSKLLKEWCRGGANGSFLDGISTVSFDGRLICWELGQVGTEIPALRQIARHLVWTQSQLQITGRSRAIRKLALFEEASKFLDLPGADSLLSHGYEEARKFNAVYAAVIQQYSRIRQLPIRASLMGNSQQFLLLRQHDIADLTGLAEDLGLPVSVTQTIKSFAEPAKTGYSAFTLFVRHAPQPICGVVHHRPSREMYYASCSTPTHVAKRRQDMKGSSDVIQKIQEASQ
ncbi:MAG: hypothetical protein JNN07_02840 [Verrucomicrobiales bacterium]|nr:hypothetical protein [Verrucomicrobiales bacterium]